MKKYRKSSSTNSVDKPLVNKTKNTRRSKYRYKGTHRLFNCDICDKTFHNSYQVLVHNASHIIIPLWKQTYYQCPECLYHYQTLQLLNEHISNKHLRNETKIKKEIAKELGNHKVREPVHNRIKFENDNNDFKEETEFDNNEINEESQIDVNQCKRNNLTDRILFEEEDDDDILIVNPCLLDDITNCCKVNIELLPPELVSEEYNSVHYDDLVAPGIYNCKICCYRFPNRFELIQHETTHLKIKKDKQFLCPFCHKYIAGGTWGLRHHKKEKHYDQELDPNIVARTCRECGLKYYNYFKHNKLYHKIYVCRVCSWRFDSEEKRQKHIDEDHAIETSVLCKSKEKIHKLCDICLILDMKSKPNFQVIGERCVLGEQQMCTRCNKKCFEVKLVRYSQTSKPRTFSIKDKKKPLTNKDRLKNIQQRFRLISKMSKL